MPSKKKIAVFFTQPNFYDYPFDDYEQQTGSRYALAYHELAQEVHKLGGEFYIARSNQTYLGNRHFCQGWVWNGAEFQAVQEFQADVIYDKSDGSEPKWPDFRGDSQSQFLNANELVEICNDKFRTYEAFQKFCPQTFLVRNKAELEKIIVKIKTEQKVLKPLCGAGGAGILIGDAGQVLAQAQDFPYVVQEFLDTSGGIPGIIAGRHDLRIIRINNENIFSYVRTPPQGSLTANLSQGGAGLPVALAQVPQAVLAMIEKIDVQFQDFTRVYSLDFCLGADAEFKLIELNAQPAMISRKYLPEYAIFQQKLAEVLVHGEIPRVIN